RGKTAASRAAPCYSIRRTRRQGMAKAKKKDEKPGSNGANLGFEQKLWAAADKLRGHMDAAEYKHVVLRLTFLKYTAAAFQDRDQRARRQGQPIKGQPGARLRILSGSIRERRGEEGRRVLHAPLRRPVAGRDDRALQGSRVRPLLRLERDVRSERRVHSPARRSDWRHLDLRPGVEPDDVEARQDELGDPRDRGKSRPSPCRHFPQRP